MRHFQQRISKVLPFGNPSKMAAQILDVENISTIVSKHSFHARDNH
jgi:hypothetical protein